MHESTLFYMGADNIVQINFICTHRHGPVDNCYQGHPQFVFSLVYIEVPITALAAARIYT